MLRLLPLTATTLVRFWESELEGTVLSHNLMFVPTVIAFVSSYLCHLTLGDGEVRIVVIGCYLATSFSLASWVGDGIDIGGSHLSLHLRSMPAVQVSLIFTFSFARCVVDPRPLPIFASIFFPLWAPEGVLTWQSNLVDNKQLLTAALAASIVLAVDHLATGSGLVRTGSRGGNRPSSWTVFGKSRAQFSEVTSVLETNAAPPAPSVLGAGFL